MISAPSAGATGATPIVRNGTGAPAIDTHPFGSRGSPRERSPMMFFITSVVPPAMVLDRLATRRRPLRMSSPAIAANPSTSAAYSAND